MENSKDVKNTTNVGNEVLADVTNRNLYCSCVRVESYRRNGLSELICGCCDKKLTKEQSDDVGRSIASYYGW